MNLFGVFNLPNQIGNLFFEILLAGLHKQTLLFVTFQKLYSSIIFAQKIQNSKYNEIRFGLQYLKEMMDQQDYKRTIYVGNLPYQVTEQQLFAFFCTFGQIKSVQIPIDEVTQKNRGFAFVQFDQVQDALSAIDNYDQTQFLERVIKVRKSKPLDLKPSYHTPVWNNDDWLAKAEQRKIQNQNLTKQQQEQNRKLGLPVWKSTEKKQEDKPIVYIEQDD